MAFNWSMSEKKRVWLCKGVRVQNEGYSKFLAVFRIFPNPECTCKDLTGFFSSPGSHHKKKGKFSLEALMKERNCIYGECCVWISR